MKRDKREQNARGGFTLIEVLLVVAILAILATVVIVNVSGHTESARINATRASIDNVGVAIRLYEVKVGKFPASLRDLTVDQEDFVAPLDKMPADAWGIELQYKVTGRGRFELRSSGPDEQFGTEDDITN